MYSHSVTWIAGETLAEAWTVEDFDWSLEIDEV